MDDIQFYRIFTFPAVASIITIVAITTQTLWSNFRNRFPENVFKPSTFVCLVYIYYALIGPFYTIFTNDLTYRSVDMSPYYPISWVGAAVSLLFFKIATLIKWPPIGGKKLYDILPGKASKIAVALFCIGFAMYAAWMGSNIMVLLHGYQEGITFHNEGSFVMYLMQGVGFFAPVCCILLWCGIKQQKIKWWYFAIFALTLLIYINSGFRFRLVYFVISMATVWYLTKGKKPSMVLWTGIAIGFLLFMGVMEETRSYEKGLDMSRAENLNSSDFLESGTNEARVFMASGVAISVTRQKENYAYLDPVLNAILMPLPFAFFPEKREFSKYWGNRIESVFGIYGVGVAVLEYAEAYVAFGWLGVCFYGFFMGWLCKAIWNYYRRGPNKLFQIMTLAFFNGFIYVFISRGYLSQIVVTAFFYVIIPLWFLKKLSITR